MKTNEIFKDFSPVSNAEWMEKIEADLKGKPLSVLTSKPEPDLEIVAYHHSETAPNKQSNTFGRNLLKPSNSWGIRQTFNDNKKLLQSLNEGVDAIGLTIDQVSDTGRLTNGVQFEYIKSDFTFNSKAVALKTDIPINTVVNFDVIAINATSGNWKFEMADFLEVYKKHYARQTIWITGSEYGVAGASTIQELAFTLAHLNEYMQYLYDQGESLSEINKKIVIELSVNENYFVNISKFRVIKDLLHLVFKGYDSNYQMVAPTIYAKTNVRHLAKNDKNNNPLRETTQAMSAVIGGCDVLTINYGDYGTPQEIERFERIAKNIQLILKEEAYLDKVVDPSGGSYAIEAISKTLLTKSWTMFQEIESKGGLITQLRANKIQDKIATNRAQLIADLVDKKRTFLGVNKHPNSQEEWTEVVAEPTITDSEFTPLQPFYLENYFPNN